MKRSRKITLKDVANHAGVSVTSVSNVVRGWPYISDEMREKVGRAIDELGYVPDPIAQGLRTGRTQAIGFIVPDLTNPFQGEIVSTVEDVAQEHGYSILAANSHENEAREHVCILQMISRKVDGLMIVLAAGTRSNAQLIGSIDIPLVLLDRVPDFYEGAYCRVDSFETVRLAMEHFRALGHRRIAHIAGPSLAITAQERLTHYAQMIDQLALDYTCVIENQEESWKAEAGYRAMRRFIEDNPDDLPTAILASNDLIAIGASQAIHEHQLAVPYDISLIGIDDIDVDEYIIPPLTSIRQPVSAVARQAIQMLLKLIEGNKLDVMQQSMAPSLIVRKSTAPPRGGE